MVILDLSIVNVALPSIQSSLNFSSAACNGRRCVRDHVRELPDARRPPPPTISAKRRVFVAALVLFSITSAGRRLAPSSGLLIAARGVQGFSCALMAASSLAIITSSFPPGPQLHRAIGLWAAMNGAGGARRDACWAASSPRRSAGAGCC